MTNPDKNAEDRREIEIRIGPGATLVRRTKSDQPMGKSTTAGVGLPSFSMMRMT
jgi:hypothetical protein